MVLAKGEVGFTALNQDWVFQFQFNAICTAEEEFDKPFVALVSELFPSAMIGIDITDEEATEAALKIRFSDLRTLFRIGLEAHHSDISDKLAGSIIHDYGTTEALALLGEATLASMGGDKAGNVPAGTAKPKPRRRS